MPLQNKEEELMGTMIDGNEITEVHQYFKGVCKKCKTII